MSRRGRELQVGDLATTDFNGHGTKTLVRIVSREETRHCQSGVLFNVEPSLRGGYSHTQYDADWFEPEPRP